MMYTFLRFAMHRLQVLSGLLIALVLSGCGGSSHDDAHRGVQPSYSDEEHRPRDWSAELNYRFVFAQPQGGEQRYALVPGSFEIDRSLNLLVDQLFDLAFSGDARLWLPTVLGEPDKSRPIGPEELVTHLNRFDTILTEDLETGELVETAIDRSFSKSRASGLVVYSDVTGSGDQLTFLPHMLMLGEQVFDESTGRLRGIQPRYFIELGEPGTSEAKQNFYFLTDSLGVFQLDHLGYFNQQGDNHFFYDLLFDGQLSDSSIVEVQQQWYFDSQRPAISLVTACSLPDQPM